MPSPIFVIAGHGAGDSGACGNGFQEQERVRVLAYRMRDRAPSDVVVLDTSRNWYADTKRGGGIYGLNLPVGSEIVELHMDSADDASARGAHVLDKPGIGFDDYDRAISIFVASFFPGRSDKLREQALANATAAHRMGYGYRLVECGFITNPGDVAKFNERMDELADGLLACFGINIENNIKEETVFRIEINPGRTPVYRSYKGRDHFFTGSEGESGTLGETWDKEGIAFYGADRGLPVYRLYNPNADVHHYTIGFTEVASLVGAGWQMEDVTFASAREDDPGAVPVWRVYNDNASEHHWTINEAERDMLVEKGWIDEGVGWWAFKDPA